MTESLNIYLERATTVHSVNHATSRENVLFVCVPEWVLTNAVLYLSTKLVASDFISEATGLLNHHRHTNTNYLKPQSNSPPADTFAHLPQLLKYTSKSRSPSKKQLYPRYLV